MNCKLNYIKENLEFITNAMNKGVPAMAIAKDLDIKYDTLKRNLNKLGVQVKTNQPRKSPPRYREHFKKLQHKI